MKLLMCSGCHDVLALQLETRRTCRCGSSSGQYREDGWDADVWGPQAVLLGLRNGLVPVLPLDRGDALAGVVLERGVVLEVLFRGALRRLGARPDDQPGDHVRCVPGPSMRQLRAYSARASGHIPSMPVAMPPVPEPDP
jgi:hypothetical protein